MLVDYGGRVCVRSGVSRIRPRANNPWRALGRRRCCDGLGVVLVVISIAREDGKDVSEVVFG